MNGTSPPFSSSYFSLSKMPSSHEEARMEIKHDNIESQRDNEVNDGIISDVNPPALAASVMLTETEPMDGSINNSAHKVASEGESGRICEDDSASVHTDNGVKRKRDSEESSGDGVEARTGAQSEGAITMDE